MTVTSVAHLNFRGDARQALEFYASVFGGQAMIGTYGEGGVPRHDPGGGPVVFDPVAADSPDADHVAFGMVVAGNGFRLAAYDVFGATGGGIAGSQPATGRRADGLTHDESMFVVLNGDDVEETTELWRKLSDGARIVSAFTAPDAASDAASGAPAYGMLTDRFGVTWIVGVTPTHD